MATISQYAKDYVDKGYMTSLKPDMQAQVDAYTAQKKDTSLKNNPYYTPDTRTNNLIDTYNKTGPLSSGAIKDVFDTTPSNIPTPTPTPTSQTAPTLPQPQAGKVQEAYMTSLSENQDKTRKRLEDTYKTELEKINKEKEALDIKQQEYLANIDPTTRPTYEQETRIMQNQLDASEAASKTIKTNFEEKQKLVDELDTLLTEGNAVITQERNAPGAVPGVITNARVNRAIQDVAARASVIESVLSARDGQIAQAHNIINQGRNAVEAQWTDKKNYYATLLDYNESKIINLDKKSQEIAKKELGLIENDLATIEATTNYLKELMIDPKTAQFVADAGVKLTDSVAEINAKMAEQTKIEEIKDTTNKLLQDGYTQVLPGAAGAVPVQAGGRTLYFKAPPEKAGGTVTERTQVAKNIATINLYSKIMQEEIDNGASPQDAVLVAAAVARSSGTTLGLEEQNALLEEAVKYATTGTTETATTETAPVSKIEGEIEQMKTSGILNNGDIRAQLRDKGYTNQEINNSSIGNVIDQISSFLFGN